MKVDTKVQLNFVDRAIAFFSPVAGARRLAARSVLNQYEAAKPSRLRKGRKANGSPNAGSWASGGSSGGSRLTIGHGHYSNTPYWVITAEPVSDCQT